MKSPLKTPKNKPVSRSLESWLMVVSVLFISLIAFETMAVATAMPYIVDILDGKNLYALAVGITLAMQLMTSALAGPWADARGPKPVFYAGVILSSVGLSIAALAPNIEWVVVGRAIQGLGSGLLIVPLYVLVGQHVHPDRQPRFFAAFATAWVLPSLVGPFIAGVFVEHSSWRLVFGMAPIIFALIMPLAIVQFRKFNNGRPAQPVRVGKIFWYALVAGVGIVLLQMVSAHEGAYTPSTYLTLGIGLALAMVFAKLLLPTGTFRAARGVPATVLLRGTTNGALAGVEMFLPLMLKELHGWSATQAGLVMTVSSISWAIASNVQGRISDPRLRDAIPVTGVVVFSFGAALTMFAAWPSITGVVVLVGWFFAGLGAGYVYPALSVHALGLMPPERHGEVSSALQIADTLGASVLIAVGGIVFALTGFLGHLSFAIPIGLMVTIMVSLIFVTTRLHPDEEE
ncbi:MAG: MFS transporter [Actinomycetaceae bacterium]|nr:MFS transporter [Actinomycetaceae bacterium]